MTLELKLLADVALVGMPNVGKSTLIRRVSHARPKVADYPFTTLEPVLGLVKLDEGTAFVIADVPGLVEGAHEGRGRGHEFLRHIERTKVIVYLLDGAGVDSAGELKILRKELGLHQSGLLERPSLVMLNKADLVPAGKRTIPPGLPEDSRWMSAATGEGVPQLLQKLAELVSST